MRPRPNILWIVTTQWRAQACGYAGDANARTPSLDSLAAQSVNFSQAVTPHPFGPFARAAMLTGLPSPENGIRDYFDPLPPGTPTVARTLAAQGYATAFFGKWHLGRRNPAAPFVGDAHAKIVVPPEERGGFDFWEGFESGFLLNDPWLHGTRIPRPERVEGYQADILCERAGQFLGRLRPSPDAGRAAPWFCVVSLEAPHPPYDAPAAGVKPRDSREVILPRNVPLGGPIEEKARRELAGYYAHIEATDRAIGRLIGEQGGDTIIVFTSAHGDMHGAHGLFRKGWPYDESIRVPLLVRGAGPVGRSDAPVSLLDLLPWTVAWSRGLEVRATSDGRSAPGSVQISMPSVVRQPHQCDRAWRGVRTASRKLVLNADGSPWLFFDLENDPLEMENLAENPAYAEERAKVAQASRLLS